MFLLILAHPGSPRQRAVKRLLLLFYISEHVMQFIVVESSIHLLMLFALMQINNPDMRVVILKNFAKEHFPSTPLIDYAGQVELITTSKVGSVFCCMTAVLVGKTDEKFLIM